jgi:ubiquinone/menaquinone biosynthesis C-methylase UbiE
MGLEPEATEDRRPPNSAATGAEDVGQPAFDSISGYWSRRIHDLEITTQPVGTPQFFDELDAYRYDKLGYLPSLLNFAAHQGKRVLEIGCGVGIDLVRFACAGANVTGMDLSPNSIDLARRNLAQRQVQADLCIMNGEKLSFASDEFDMVYAHGVLPYARDAAKIVSEMHRVLRPGGEALVMVYNRNSWLNALSRVTRVPLEHADAPFMQMHSLVEFRRLLQPFARVRIVVERFPVATRLHHGLKARLFNSVFVKAFNRLPKPLTRTLGWHLVALASK